MSERAKRAMLARVWAVGVGGTINGAYKVSPVPALDAFRADLLALVAMVEDK